MGQVVADGGVGFEDVGEVQIVRPMGREAAVADDGSGRIGGGEEVALEALHSFEQAAGFVRGEGVFDDDVAIDVEMVALGGGEGGEGAGEFGGRHGE